MTQHDELETQVEDGGEIICLFGIDGSVGMHFAKLALLAGYHIQALSPSPIDIQHDNLTLWEGDMTATDVILEEMLKGATYVVCLLSSSVSRKDYAEGTLLDFVKRLYPKMIESPVRLFLYQATAVTVDTKYKAPVFADSLKLLKRKILFRNDFFQKDQDAIVKLIGEKAPEEWFHFIVTRPGPTKEGPRRKLLAASKSLPGPFPVTTLDLADFTLCALKMEKLYNTCPYVVGDGFL